MGIFCTESQFFSCYFNNILTVNVIYGILNNNKGKQKQNRL